MQALHQQGPIRCRNILVALPFIFLGCTSLNLSLLSRTLPVYQSISVNMSLPAGSYCLYRVTDHKGMLPLKGSFRLDIIDKTDTQVVVKLQSVNDSSFSVTPMSPPGLDDFYHEYHLGYDSRTIACYLVADNGKRHLCPEPYTAAPGAAEILVRESGYRITTLAGSFPCELIITKTVKDYMVAFHSDKTLLPVVRMLRLNTNQYDKFIALSRTERESYIDSMEVELKTSNINH